MDSGHQDQEISEVCGQKISAQFALSLQHLQSVSTELQSLIAVVEGDNSVARHFGLPLASDTKADKIDAFFGHLQHLEDDNGQIDKTVCWLDILHETCYQPTRRDDGWYYLQLNGRKGRVKLSQADHDFIESRLPHRLVSPLSYPSDVRAEEEAMRHVETWLLNLNKVTSEVMDMNNRCRDILGGRLNALSQLGGSNDAHPPTTVDNSNPPTIEGDSKPATIESNSNDTSAESQEPSDAAGPATTARTRGSAKGKKPLANGAWRPEVLRRLPQWVEDHKHISRKDLEKEYEEEFEESRTYGAIQLAAYRERKRKRRHSDAFSPAVADLPAPDTPAADSPAADSSAADLPAAAAPTRGDSRPQVPESTGVTFLTPRRKFPKTSGGMEGGDAEISVGSLNQTTASKLVAVETPTGETPRDEPPTSSIAMTQPKEPSPTSPAINPSVDETCTPPVGDAQQPLPASGEETHQGHVAVPPPAQADIVGYFKSPTSSNSGPTGTWRSINQLPGPEQAGFPDTPLTRPDSQQADTEQHHAPSANFPGHPVARPRPLDSGFQETPIPAVPGIPKPMKSRAACQTCREKQVKCDRQRPACDTCRQSNVICRGYSKQARAGFQQPSTQRSQDNRSPRTSWASHLDALKKQHTEPGTAPYVSKSPEQQLPNTNAAASGYNARPSSDSRSNPSPVPQQNPPSSNGVLTTENRLPLPNNPSAGPLAMPSIRQIFDERMRRQNPKLTS